MRKLSLDLDSGRGEDRFWRSREIFEKIPIFLTTGDDDQHGGGQRSTVASVEDFNRCSTEIWISEELEKERKKKVKKILKGAFYSLNKQCRFTFGEFARRPRFDLGSAQSTRQGSAG